MPIDEAENCALLVAECIIGDDGVPVRSGDRLNWSVRTPDPKDGISFARLFERH